MRTIVFLLLCASAVWAQSAEEPLALGFTFDSTTGQARTIAGTRGAARLARRDTTVYSAAAVDRRTGLLIGCATPDAPILVHGNSGADPVPVKDARAGADRIVLSPGGRAAAATFNNAGVIEIITGLPDIPAVAREIQLDGGASLTALAVADDGGAVAATTASGVIRFGPDGAAELLAPAATAIGFVAGSHDLLVADHDRGSVQLYGAGTGKPELLASTNDGIDSPTAAYLSPDRRQLIVGTTSAVVLRDREAGTSIAIAVPAPPTGFAPLASEGLYLVRAETGEAAWVLDTKGAAPGLWFVPAAEADEVAQ